MYHTIAYVRITVVSFSRSSHTVVGKYDDMICRELTCAKKLTESNLY